MAFFKKKMSDKDFKMMLENDAREQREAKTNIEFTMPHDNAVKKAPMVLTPEELLGNATTEKPTSGNTQVDTIDMAGSSTSTEDFLFKKMLEAREEQTKVATTPQKTVTEEPKVEAPIYDPNESIEEMLRRMEEKAQREVNSRYGYTAPETKTEPVVSTPIKEEVTSALDGILEEILEPKKDEKKETAAQEFNVESLINDMKADVGIYNTEKTEDISSFFTEEVKAEEIKEETVVEEAETENTDDNIQQEKEEIIDIISDEEFIDAEDITKNGVIDQQPTEQFTTNIFDSIKEKEPESYEDISSNYDDDDDYEDEEEFDNEYQTIDDKEKTLKFIKKGKAFSVISLLIGIATAVLAFLGEVVFKDGGSQFLTASAICFVLAVALNTNLLKAFGRMFVGKITSDFAVATASILAAIYNILCIYIPTLNLIPLFLASTVPLIITEAVRLGRYSRIKRSFRLMTAEGLKNALVFAENTSAKKEAASITSFEEANICLTKKTNNIIGFIKNTYTKESSGYTVGIISLFGLAFAIAAAVGAYFSEAISPISCFMATLLLVATPAAVLITELPLKLANNRLKFYGSAIFGERSCNELDNTNCVNIDIADVFPEGTVKLMDFKLLSPNPIDQTLLDAAALTKVAKSPLAGIFKQITDETDDVKEVPVDTVVYEERMGISGWVDDRRVFVGNRTLMEAHGFRVPSLDVDKKVLQRGYFPVYLGSENVLCALLIVKYTAHPDIALELKRLASTGASILINNCDQNVTGEMVEDYLGLYEDSVYITTRSLQKALNKEAEEVECTYSPAVVGNNVCGLVSTITAAIKIKKLSKAISVLYVILTICALAGLVTAVFLGQFGFISSIVIAAALALTTLLCSLPTYISRP